MRVAIDLSGTDEPLGNGMELLAGALESSGDVEVVRFRTGKESAGPNETSLPTRALWRPLWQRGLGRSVDELVAPIDVVHVGGPSTPPTKHVPLIVTVDDLRPLRDDSRGRQRAAQLVRAVGRGARLVATSRAASDEVQRTLGLAREEVLIANPAVAWDRVIDDGENLVVNLTGRTDAMVQLAPALIAMARRRRAKVVVLASSSAQARLRHLDADLAVRARRDAAAVLAGARVVVHLSDGARFPRFAIAALAAGVPVLATTTAVNRELLDGAAVLADESDETGFVSAIDELWESDARRTVLAAAGRARSADFAPQYAAQRHLALYLDAVRARGRL